MDSPEQPVVERRVGGTRRLGLLVLVAIAIAAPFVLSRWFDALPAKAVIAGGTAGGRFHQLACSIRDELRRLGVEATIVTTEGSVENLKALDEGADLAIYQPSLALGDRPKRVRFIANLYPQPVHVIVREASGLSELGDLRGKRVGIGVRGSGDHELNRVLLTDLGIPLEAVRLVEEPLDAMRKKLLAGELDAMLVTQGIGAKMFPGVLDRSGFRLLSVPYLDSLERKRPSLRRFKISKGLYYAYPRPVPAHDIWTVGVEAQLLTSNRVDSRFVERVTRLLHSRDFLLRNQLLELYRDDATHAYARQQPSFPHHPGATNFYEPELKPLISPEFIEATEGLRSFVVSMLIAGYLLVRWLHRRRERKRGSRLDRYMQGLLRIEHDQLRLDQSTESEDIEELQRALREVSALRREALGAFNSYEMSDEPGVDMFLEMSHALSGKINAKLSRQRLDLALRKFADSVGGA